MAKQPDWADDVVTKAIDGYQWNGRKRKSPICLREIAAKILRAERARAVRVVNSVRPYAHTAVLNEPLVKVADILAKLKEA